MQSSEIQIGLVYLLLPGHNFPLDSDFIVASSKHYFFTSPHRHTSCSCLLHLPGGSRGHYRHPIACIDLSSKIEEVPFKALILKANKTSNT